MLLGVLVDWSDFVITTGRMPLLDVGSESRYRTLEGVQFRHYSYWYYIFWGQHPNVMDSFALKDHRSYLLRNYCVRYTTQCYGTVMQFTAVQAGHLSGLLFLIFGLIPCRPDVVDARVNHFGSR